MRGLPNVVARWARRDVAVALARIAAGAYGAATFGYYVTVSPKVLDRGVVRNALDDAEQRGLRNALLLAAVLALVLVATLVRRGRRDSASEPWRRLVDGSFAPFLLAPLGVWPLCEAAGPYYLHVIGITAISALFGFALHSFATHAPRARLLEVIDAPSFTRAAPLLVLAIGLAHGVLLASIAVSKIQTLTSAWDLAIFAQVTWNIVHGGVPSSSMYYDEPINHYGVHFSPIHHLVALFYWARPTPTTLVVVSNLAVGIAALPAYLLGKRITGRTTLGFLLAISYLLHPGRYGVALHEYHEIVFFPLFAFGLLWAISADRTKLAWAFFVLAIIVREDVPIYLVVIAVWTWTTGRRALASQMAVAALAYFVVVNGVFMPALRTGPSLFEGRYSGMVRQGGGALSIVQTAVTNPVYVARYVVSDADKWLYVVVLLLPVAFAPLLSWRAFAVLIPGLAFILLAVLGAHYDFRFHYTGSVLPFLYFAAFLVLARLPPRVGLTLAASGLLAAALLSREFGLDPILAPARTAFDATWRHDRHGDDPDRIRSAIEQIPPDACVRATTALLVPLSGRKGAYVVPWGKRCDWALLEYTPAADFGPSRIEAEHLYLRESLASGDFGVVYLDDRVVLIGRGKPTTQNAEVLERIRRLDVETAVP